MSDPWTDSVVAPVLLVEIEWVSGTTRVWSGIGDLAWDSKTWSGIGDLGGVSPIEETSEIRATGVQLFVNGVDPSLLSLALADAAHGDSVRIWLGFLDATDQLAGVPILVFSGWIDQPIIEEGAETARIVVAAESEMIDLKRARVRRYTDQDQRDLHAGDRFFEFVDDLPERDVKWG